MVSYPYFFQEIWLGGMGLKKQEAQQANMVASTLQRTVQG